MGLPPSPSSSLPHHAKALPAWLMRALALRFSAKPKRFGGPRISPRFAPEPPRNSGPAESRVVPADLSPSPGGGWRCRDFGFPWMFETLLLRNATPGGGSEGVQAGQAPLLPNPQTGIFIIYIRSVVTVLSQLHHAGGCNYLFGQIESLFIWQLFGILNLKMQTGFSSLEPFWSGSPLACGDFRAKHL